MYLKDSHIQTWWKTIVETQVQVIKKHFGATQLIRRLDGIIVGHYKRRRNALDNIARTIEDCKQDPRVVEHARDGTFKLLISIPGQLKNTQIQA